MRDVLAHMTGTAKISAPGFFGKMITSGINPADPVGPKNTWKHCAHGIRARRLIGA